MFTEPRPRGSVLAVAVVFEIGLGLVACFLGALLGVSPLRTLTPDLRTGAYGLAAVLPLLLLFHWSVRSPWPPLRQIRRAILPLIRLMFRGCSSLDLALVSIAAGLGEELLFRGLIQGGFVLVLGPLPALAVASLLFGLAHAITPAYAVLATAIGVYLGVLWQATDNLFTVIVTHAVYDFLALRSLVRPGRRRPG